MTSVWILDARRGFSLYEFVCACFQERLSSRLCWNLSLAITTVATDAELRRQQKSSSGWWRHTTRQTDWAVAKRHLAVSIMIAAAAAAASGWDCHGNTHKMSLAAVCAIWSRSLASYGSHATRRRDVSDRLMSYAAVGIQTHVPLSSHRTPDIDAFTSTWCYDIN